MVWQEKVTLIWMLCPLQEAGKIKWAEYWPNGETEKTMNIEDEFMITFETLIENKSSQVQNWCRIKELKIKNISTNEERSLIHYNFLTWPDFGTPEESEFEVIDDMIERISDIENSGSNKSKIIVHCSAGIGRTGTLIAIYNAISTIQHYIDSKNVDNGKISVFAIVRRLREQRYHMVHNEMQYEFIYQFIHYWFNKLGIDDTSVAKKEDKVAKKFGALVIDDEPQTQEGVSQGSDNES